MRRQDRGLAAHAKKRHVKTPPAPTASRRVALSLAGAASLSVAADEPIALGPQHAALLAWLALEGPTPRARVCALLWPESSATDARNNLRQRLFRLHKLCGAELIVGTSTLELAASVTHDLSDADTLLAKLPDEFGGEFQTWLDAQRTRRRERLTHALVELAHMAERAGDLADALIHANELLALQPLSEEAHRRVVQLHYLAGDRAAALLAFDRCEQLLKDEIGTRPSAETLALLRTVEQSTDLQASRTSGRVPAAVLRPPRLIGRDACWQAIETAWNEGRRVVVTGEGGMGKSRLVGDFARTRGAVVMASARPGDELVAYLSFSRLLRALAPQTLRDLDPSLRQELARLLPELGGAAALRSAADQARFVNAVRTVLDHPPLRIEGFVFDDLHFADDASLELLQAVVADSKRRWLIAARAGEVSSTGRAMLDGLIDDPQTEQLRLPPLTEAQIAELIDSLGVAQLDGATQAGALLRHTGGNPLYLLETLKTWLSQANAPLPQRWPQAESIGRLIERRIGRLSRPAVQLARCAAIAAPAFSVELAAQVLGVRTIELTDPLAELEAAQVLRPDGAFTHDLVYSAAVASVPQSLARQLHAEIAQFLQGRGAEPAHLALHWERAQRWPAAAAAYLQAAAQALERARGHEHADMLAAAARCFALAGDAQRQFTVLNERAQVIALHDAGEAASRALDDLQAAAQSQAQSLDVLAARLELAVTRFEIDEALALAPQAIAAARAQARDELVLRLSITYSGALGDARRTAEGVAVLRPFMAAVHRLADAELEWSLREAWALALDYDGQLRESAAGWLECQRLAERLDRHDMLWRSLSNGAAGLAKMGLMTLAVEQSTRAWQLATGLGETGRVRLLQQQAPHAHRLRDLGHFDLALPMLEACLEGFRAEGSAVDIALAEQRLAVLFMQLGQPARAQQLLACDAAKLPAGIAMFQAVLRASLAHQPGHSAEAAMHAALELVPNPDDIFRRMGTLYATAVLAPAVAEPLAIGLASWAGARERRGLALAAHVRAAAAALALAAPERALPHAEAALHLAREHRPDSFYLAELWLVAAQAHLALGDAAAAWRVSAQGHQWVLEIAAQHVPEAFRDSFLLRNPVNRELLAMHARLTQGLAQGLAPPLKTP
jgi:DNA-binding SARP family transcriptional activator